MNDLKPTRIHGQPQNHKQNKMKNLLTRSQLIALVACYAISLNGQTLLEETWSDGERSTQSLTNSAAWYSSGSGSLTSAVGSMTQMLTNTTAMDIAYFTDAYDSVVSLAVGETLELAYSISFINRIPPLQSYFRVGLYKTIVDPRITADGGATSNPAYVGATGYILNTGGLNPGVNVDLRRRNNATSSNLMSSTSAYATLSGNTTFQTNVDNDVIYNGVLRITRTGESINTIQATLTAPDDTVVFSFASTDSTSVYKDFNTVAFISGGSNGDAFKLTSVKVSVIAAPSVTWNGNVDANWDTTTANWVGTTNKFADGSLTRFDDSATGATGVDLVGTLSPGGLTVSNSALAYTFQSTGLIAGMGGLTKQGTESLTLANSGGNSFLGGVYIQSGTVILKGGDNRLPVGALTMGSGGDSGLLQLGDATGPVSQTFRSLAVSGFSGGNAVVGGNSAVSTLIVSNSSTMTYGGNLGGSENHQNNLTLVKAGSGTLTLTGPNTYNGGTVISQGRLLVDVEWLLGSGGITLQTLGEFAATYSGGYSKSLNLASGIGRILPGTGVTMTWAGEISGRGTLEKRFGGDLILTVNNSYTGGTRLGGGKLIVGEGSTSGSLGTGEIVLSFQSSATTLEFNRSDTVLVADAISGNSFGTLLQAGSGTLTLGGSNTFVGNTMVNAGNLALAAGGAMRFVIGGSGTNNTITGFGGLNLNGTLVFDLITAGTTPGDFWSILDSANLTESYGGSFAVSSLAGPFANTGGVWTRSENGVVYRFDQSTGQLSVSTAPSSPTIAPVAVDGTNMVVSVPTVSGATYVLQSATNLTPVINWVNESTNAGTGGNLILNVPIRPDRPQNFLRFLVY